MCAQCTGSRHALHCTQTSRCGLPAHFVRANFKDAGPQKEIEKINKKWSQGLKI